MRLSSARILVLIVAAALLFAQGGNIDHTGDNSTSMFAVHDQEPGGCKVPEQYFNSITRTFRWCSSQNRWSDFGGSVAAASATALAQSASISTTNLLVGGAMAPAGFYRLNVWAEPTNGHTGSGSVAPVVNWHSEGSTYTITGNTISLASTVTSSFALPIIFHHDGTAHISYSATYASTGQYSLYVILERMSN